MNTTDTTTEFLTGIKFKNAVRRATRLRVANSGQYGRFLVYVDRTPTEGVFHVWYRGGDFSVSQSDIDNKARLHADLLAAGFEPAEFTFRTFGLNSETKLGWRKSVKA